jgi:hypothetical protein
MITPANSMKKGHSADVRIQLHLNGSVLGVAQLGRDFLILETGIDHPPTQAELAIQVDRHERRWPIYLAEGIQAGRRKTVISRCQASTVA